MYDYYDRRPEGLVTVEYGSDRVWAKKANGVMKDFGSLSEAYTWLGVAR